MARHVARILARGWYRDARNWWRATAVLMALVLSLVLSVAGTFEGMEREADARLEAFFTGDVRVTPLAPAVAPAQHFANWTDTAATIQEADPDAEVLVRYESTYVLSRRGLLDAYLEEDDGFEVQAPGTVTDPTESYRVGALIGMDLDDTSRDRMRPYLTVGRFPSNAEGPVELLLSERAYRGLLTDEEFDALPAWPPAAARLAAFDLEITTARLDATSSYKDVVRLQAHVVGLFRTDLDAMDSFTAVTSIDAARRLDAAPSDAANALQVLTDRPDAVAHAVTVAGHGAEDTDQFATRYLGQFIEVVRGLSITVTVLLFAFPAFLLWYGLSQQLDRNQREVAVCRAIGVPRRDLLRAVALLAGRVTALGLLGTAVAAILAGLALATWLPEWAGSPLPLGFVVPWWGALMVLVISGLSLLAAWVLTARNQMRLDLATSLRSP